MKAVPKERNNPSVTNRTLQPQAGWAFSSSMAEGARGGLVQCSGQREIPGNAFSRVRQAGRQTHTTPERKALRVRTRGSPLRGPAVRGAAELAGPGRCVAAHTRSDSAPWSFLSHAALKSEGWYRETESCSFPVAIKVFFVRQ